jgi:hypothetical protein
MLAGLKGYSQATTQKADSLQLKTQQGQNDVEADEQDAMGNANGQTNRNNATKTVKQVKGRRPDMSKARGARPPMIVRPSGSGIPKGAGKPGGVGRKGGR